MQTLRFPAGETIFTEGDPSTDCYKIVSGEVEIRLTLPNVMRRSQGDVIAHAGPGEIIGEMGAIDGGPRSATAIASRPTVCEVFTAEEILELLQNDPEEALAYVRTLIQRIRHANRKVSLAKRPRD